MRTWKAVPLMVALAALAAPAWSAKSPASPAEKATTVASGEAAARPASPSSPLIPAAARLRDSRLRSGMVAEPAWMRGFDGFRSGFFPAEAVRTPERVPPPAMVPTFEMQGGEQVGFLPGPVTITNPPPTEAAGDFYIMSGSNDYGTAIRRAANPAGGLYDYTFRYPTSQVAKQLPFSVSGAWILADNIFTYHAGWQFSVVLESTTNRYWPDPALQVGTTTWDGRTAFPSGCPLDPAQNCGNTPSCQQSAGYTPIRFAAAAPYPPAAKFAINDGSHNDTFDGRTEPLMTAPIPTNWIECTGTACFATQNLQVASNAVSVAASGANLTNLGWRLFDRSGWVAPTGTALSCGGATGVPCPRYIHSYIENDYGLNPANELIQSSRYGTADSFSWFEPDQDLRMTIQYDLSSNTARTAGVFARGELDFSVAATPITNFYAIFVDKASSTVRVTDHTLALVAPTATAPLPPGANLSGTMMVEIEGYDPVQIRVYFNGSAAPTLSVSDSTLKFHGDVGFGNIYGIIFPNAGGGELIQDFQTRRNSDLFVQVRFPPATGGTTPCAFLWADREEESRQFNNTFYGAAGSPWQQPYVQGCAKSIRNTIVNIETRDDANMVQINNTLSSVYMPCCNCIGQPFGCAGTVLDDCPSAPLLTGERPLYVTGERIEFSPRLTNEHTASFTDRRLLICYLVCNDADPTCSFATCDPDACSANYNCDCLGVTMDTAGLSPGQRDGGLVQRRLSGPPPNPTCPSDPTALLMSFVPQTAGDYHVYMFEDSYVLTTCPAGNPNCCPGGTPAPCIIDPNPDEYLPNRFVSRPFHVDAGTCTAIAYNFRKESLKMARVGRCTNPTEIEAQWAFVSPGPDVANTPFNLHEVLGGANKPQTGQNPVGNTPLVSFVGPPNPPTNACFLPGTVSNDVNYYEIHQADSCTGLSLADQ